MILLAIAALMIAFALAGLAGGYCLAAWEFGKAADLERWRANLWKRRCEELEQQDHVRFVGVHPVREPGGR